jgi:DNA-binding NarL/FixJ family response regulator
VANILIIDDSPMTRQMLKRMLELGGHTVVGMASEGDAGLDMAVQLRPDVVMLDMILPGRDGLEVLRLLRQRFPQLKIVMLSGVSDLASIKQARAAGATHYIIKPFQANTVSDVLQTCLRQTA